MDKVDNFDFLRWRYLSDYDKRRQAKIIAQERAATRLKLEEEGGITQISLRNTEKLIQFFGPIRFVQHSTYDDDLTTVFFENGFEYELTGFSCGYGGEGPNGLVQFLSKFLFRKDITIEQVAKWTRHKIYVITKGLGDGFSYRTYSCADMEYELEIW